jgi:hypothetical protein
MVWLISKRGDPARFILCDAFVADEVGRNARGPFKYFAKGSDGWFFRKFVVIDDKPWFEKLRRATGNFGFGLQSLRDMDIIRGLDETAVTHGERRIPQ